MAKKTEVTIINGHRYAVHVAGRRFRPGRPRTMRLTDIQLEAVRNNPWLWIEGEDDEVVEELEEDQVPVVSVGGGWYEFADGERIKGKNNLPENAVIVDEFPAIDEDEGDGDDDVDDEEEEESDDDETSTEADDDGEEQEES